MTPPVIDTPKGTIVVDKYGKAELKFKPDFQPKWQENYSDAQKFVDSEVLRLSEPYTPLRTGMLVKSSILGTDVGSGEVAWIAPYAKAQYYRARKAGSETGPLRGPYWFARMWAVNRDVVIEGARRRAGGQK